MQLKDFERLLQQAKGMTGEARRAFVETLKGISDDGIYDDSGVRHMYDFEIEAAPPTPMSEQEIDAAARKAADEIWARERRELRARGAPFDPTGRSPRHTTRVWESDAMARDFAKFLVGAHRKTLSTNIDSAGGHLVPEEFSSVIINLANEYGVFRRYARVLPMSSDTIRVPRVTGRNSTYWVGEGNDITASNMTFDRVTLTARKLTSLQAVTSELMEDSSIALADLVGREMARQIGQAEDEAAFNGDGSSTYGGIQGVINLLSTTNGVDEGGGLALATGNSYSEVTLADLTRLMGALPAYALPNAKWYCSSSVAHQVILRNIVAAGGATASEISGGASAMRLLGKEVVLCETLPSVAANSQICLLFGDLSLAATFGDRRQLRVETFNTGTVGSTNLLTADLVAIRATERVDINIHDVGDASTAGPIVGLITASS